MLLLLVLQFLAVYFLQYTMSSSVRYSTLSSLRIHASTNQQQCRERERESGIDCCCCCPVIVVVNLLPIKNIYYFYYISNAFIVSAAMQCHWFKF